jgi:hypothetical protein
MDLVKPDFLKHVKVSKLEAIEAAERLAPWHKTIKDSANFTKRELEIYIITEINSRRRSFVLSRLVTRLGMFEKKVRYADITKVLATIKADVLTPLIKKAGKLPELKG